MCLVIESGWVWFLVYRVWCFHQLNWSQCQHPASRSGSILPDCFIRILVSSGRTSLLVVVHPVGSLQVLLVHSRYLFAVGDRCILTAHPHPDSRSPCDRDLFCSDRRVHPPTAGGCWIYSRQLSRHTVADPWWQWSGCVVGLGYEIKWSWMKSEGGLVFLSEKIKKIFFFCVVVCLDTNVVSWFSLIANLSGRAVNLSGMSICQCHYISVWSCCRLVVHRCVPN